MFKPTIFDVPTTPRLINLLQEVREGIILIPDFQRPFVWDDQQRLDLFDSISRGLPIGGFMLWRTSKHSLKVYENLGPFGFKHRKERSSSDRRYLLDGHQRLTTLYAALNVSESDKLSKDDASYNELKPIYYDSSVRDEEGSATGEGKKNPEPKFVIPRKKDKIPNTWLPLSLLFSGRKLWEFVEKLRKEDKHDEADRCTELAEVFKDYSIPLVPLVTEDMDLVTRCFVRLNRGGSKMKESHMLRALTSTSEELDPIDQQFETLRSELSRYGSWSELDDQVLINALKIQYRIQIYGDTEKLHDKLEHEGYDKALKTFGRSVITAVRVLADLGIRGAQALPYQYHLIALADAARSCPFDMMKAKRAKLRKWLYATMYTSYTVGQVAALRKSGEHIKNIIERDADPLPADMAREVFSQDSYNFTSTRSKAFAMFLIEKISPGTLRKDTEALLGTEGPGAVQRILPRTSGDTESRPENRVVALPEELDKIRTLIRDPNHPEAKTYYQRYLIPEEAAMALVKYGEENGSEEFLRIRGDFLIQEERKFIESFGLIPRFGET